MTLSRVSHGSICTTRSSDSKKRTSYGIVASYTTSIASTNAVAGWLAAAVAGTVLLQLVVVYVPVFNRLFDTVPLPSGDLALATLLASAVFAAVEIEKLLRRRADRTKPVSPTQNTYLTRQLSN
jgi:hypothetical protein